VSVQIQKLFTLLATYVLLVAIASIVAYLLYWFDKRRAIAGGRRVPENTLHWASLLGGWPGAIVAQQRLRHKTQKQSFRIVFWITVCLNIVATAMVLYWVLTNDFHSS
jgi:uncharacterized membrane protein YsdA (DUF1294 family)